MSEFDLSPGHVTLNQLAAVYWKNAVVRLNRSAKPTVLEAASRIAAAANGNHPVYGVNTGFGKLASMKIEPGDTAQLQRNLILSHCCGVGELVDEKVVRLMMTLKLLSFGRGASGVGRPL